MADQVPERRSDCPVSYSLDIFGDRWTLLVVRDIVFTGKRRFREFLASEEGIASNILADRLKTLECCGIVSRRPDPQHAAKVIYALTEKGKDLIPALLELRRWGAKYAAGTVAPPQFVRRIRQDREGLIAELRAASAGAQMKKPA